VKFIGLGVALSMGGAETIKLVVMTTFPVLGAFGVSVIVPGYVWPAVKPAAAVFTEAITPAGVVTVVGLAGETTSHPLLLLAVAV
jgi:hypothetical protein